MPLEVGHASVPAPEMRVPTSSGVPSVEGSCESRSQAVRQPTQHPHCWLYWESTAGTVSDPLCLWEETGRRGQKPKCVRWLRCSKCFASIVLTSLPALLQ